MSIIYSYSRLYGAGFILSSILSTVVFVLTDHVSAAIITKYCLLPAITFLNFEKFRKHSYYYQNLGFSLKKLFALASTIDFIAFSVMIFITALIVHYA